MTRIRTRLQSYSIETLLRSFRFIPDVEKLLREAARTIGFALRDLFGGAPH